MPDAGMCWANEAGHQREDDWGATFAISYFKESKEDQEVFKFSGTIIKGISQINYLEK